jgi:hypothetical protein
MTYRSFSPEGCWILAGDNIPGNPCPMLSRPEGALESTIQNSK